MAQTNSPRAEKIKQVVRHLLGAERVRLIESEEMLNDDGATIVRVRVVYDAEKGISVDEMDKIVDLIWMSDDSGEMPFPVIDFEEDTDVVSTAAQ